MSTADTVLAILERVSDVPEVRENPDLPLFDLGILDSFKTVQLIVALSEELGVEISPAELDREQWATPRAVCADISARLVPS